jgi:predicted O-methyltransferase YrrM
MKNHESLRVVQDRRVREVLGRLHRESDRQNLSLVGRFASQVWRWSRGQRLDWARLEPTLRDRFLAVDPANGAFLYLLARALRAQTVVEFGTSYGVSTIYLALAVRDNGGGRVIGTERVPEKAQRARAYLREAGLEDFADICVGDAPESLLDLPEPVDLLFNDGFPQAMLPVLQCVAPRMRQGAVALAGNAALFPADHADYLDWVRDPANGFCSGMLSMRMAGEFSVKVTGDLTSTSRA